MANCCTLRSAGKVVTLLAMTMAIFACTDSDQVDSQADAPAKIPVRVGAVTIAIPTEYFGDPTRAESASSARTVFEALHIPIDSEPGETGDVAESDTFYFVAKEKVAGATAPLEAESVLAWEQQESFANRIVRPDKAARLVRIFGRDEFPRAWHFFENRPTGDSAIDWVAKCSVPEGVEEDQGFTNVACITEAPFEDLFLEIHFSGTRIGCRDRIVKRALALAAEWQSG